MNNKRNKFKEESLNKKIKEMIAKSKKLNLVKPLASAFEKNPCEKECHKGKNLNIKQMLN